MTYEKKKAVIEAAKLLKEHCLEHKRCDDGCVFYDEGDVLTCPFYKNNADDFKIPKLTRWTPEDVALAKALKTVGVEWIARDFKGDIALLKNGIQLGEIVKITNVFADLKEDRIEFIDTIIKEAEG